MDGPDIPGIVAEGGSGPVLAFGEVAVLLQSEGIHPLHVAPARLILRPGAQDSLDDPPQALLVPEEEIQILGHLEGEEIAWIMEERSFEEVDGALPLATAPGLRGQHVEPLAFAGAENPGVDPHDEVPRRLEPRLSGRVQSQVCLQDASEDEVRVGRRRVGERNRLAAQGEQSPNGALENGDRFPVRREHRAAPPVDECVTQRRLLRSGAIIPQRVASPLREEREWRTTPVPAGRVTASGPRADA